MLHPGFDDVTGVNTDPKGRFVSFKVKLIHLMTDFYVSMLLGVGGGEEHSNREQLARECFFEGLQSLWKTKPRGMKTR